jgi:ssDNA thymidine ADP-ribosyltransferase, DarT
VSVREKIQAIALAKKVPFLVHFTRSENIPSIMQHGLVPMSIANDIGLKPTINDQLRLDGRLNGTSLSISFPNGQLFYRLRKENPDTAWAVLAISASVLWSKDVLFCRHNAADTRVSKVSSDTLRQAETFTSLFEELEGVESRLEQGIKDCDPTDVQAEALVMEPIEPEFILGALFNDKATLDAFTPHFGKRKLILHEGRKGVFANRTYYRKFGGG